MNNQNQLYPSPSDTSDYNNNNNAYYNNNIDNNPNYNVNQYNTQFNGNYSSPAPPQPYQQPQQPQQPYYDYNNNNYNNYNYNQPQQQPPPQQGQQQQQQQQQHYSVSQSQYGHHQYIAPSPQVFKVRQKFLSLTGDMTIEDQFGVDVFKARAKIFSFGLNMKIEDLQGNELALIKEKILSFRKTYKIYREDNFLGQVVKKFTFLKPKFEVDLSDTPQKDDIVIRGNIFDHEFLMYRGESISAKISKQFFSLRDTYGVEVMPGEDVVLMLCIAVIIDKCLHEGDN